MYVQLTRTKWLFMFITIRVMKILVARHTQCRSNFGEILVILHFG